MRRSRKIILSLMTLSIITNGVVGFSYSASASQRVISKSETNQISDLLNNVLSYDQQIMKTGESIDYSGVINDEKLLEMINSKISYKEKWYNDINYKISDYTSNVLINDVTKTDDNKYMLDVTFKAKLTLSKDSDIHPEMSDNYVIEVEKNSEKWLINKIINKADYQDIVGEKENNKAQLYTITNDTSSSNNNSILDKNDIILDKQLDEVKIKLNDIDKSVNEYKNTLEGIKNIKENGSEKATPSYSGTNRTAIARYAYKYAINHNSSYKYINGADCTNFASQAVYAGGVPSSSYWSSYSSAWVNVPQFYNYMSNNGYLSGGNSTDDTSTGDVVQWKHSWKADYSHSTIVTGYDDTFGIMLSAHSNDRQNYPLANYWSDFSSARNMHFW